VPKELRDREMCGLALRQNGRALSYVPQELRDRDMYRTALAGITDRLAQGQSLEDQYQYCRDLFRISQSTAIDPGFSTQIIEELPPTVKPFFAHLHPDHLGDAAWLRKPSLSSPRSCLIPTSVGTTTLPPDNEDLRSEQCSSLVSRNVKIHGHRTSVRLEPQMWDSMIEICRREFCTPDDVCSYVAERKPAHGSLS
jgi:hypothetical protein